MYISNEDRVIMRKVEDSEVNEVFQEALKSDPSLMIIQKKVFLGKPFYKRGISTLFEIYHETPALGGAAYQARHQASGSGKKEVVMAYLYGIINGANCIKQKNPVTRWLRMRFGL